MSPDARADLQQKIEAAWADRSLLDAQNYQSAVRRTLDALDQGQLRVAEPPAAEGGEWTVNAWVKQAILLYFPMQKIEVMEAGMLEFHDKIPVKRGWATSGVRVVPPAIARYGSYLEPGVILMPSYVNIGAWVGEGTMVDTWATVGSCAQIGRGVHLSGGVGIGGVLEPPQAAPVVIEDGAFVGSRCIVVEGVRVGREAVLGAGVVLTASTKIINVTGAEPREHRGYVPPRSVVIPGSIPKQFAAGTYQVPCALIIGQRSASTDLKTSLNDALREHGVAV
jgi:2,3,4,5-tetrahydropyridine-2-carboxylate N-succinyltransferase